MGSLLSRSSSLTKVLFLKESIGRCRQKKLLKARLTRLGAVCCRLIAHWERLNFVGFEDTFLLCGRFGQRYRERHSTAPHALRRLIPRPSLGDSKGEISVSPRTITCEKKLEKGNLSFFSR